MEPKIIFEDEEILVLEKPAGMVVNRATSVKEETVQDWVARNFQFPWQSQIPLCGTISPAKRDPALRDNFQLFRNGIVHRLDKETSGLLLVAKTPEAFVNLQRQFKERKVKKKYLALVEGKVEPSEGEIRAPVGRLPWDREKFGVFPGGREAKTKYKVVGSYAQCTIHYALLELVPETGRTHQIRVHLKYLGHPVVGDENYAGRKKAREQRKWCPRLFLHAAFLAFSHPKTAEKMSFESQLPSDLKIVLDKLTA